MKQIIWAVDPYLDDEQGQRRIVECLAALASPCQANIAPVSVLVADEGMGTYPPGLPKELRPVVERRIDAFVKSTPLPRLAEPVFLSQDHASTRGAVDEVLHYAHESGADLIAVSTHSRKGVDRLFLGSFAETLLLRSDIPVLSVGPHSNRMENIREVLFPTDLSEKANRALERVLPLVRALGAKLILFHYFSLVPEVFFPLEAGPAYVKAVDDYENWEREEGQALLAKVRAAGIDAELVCTQKGTSAAEVILAFASKMSSALIAMTSQTGPVAAALLGSVTRQVVRGAPWPVWVLHPTARP